MPSRKIIIHQKNAMKPIILTDTSDDTLDQIKEKVKKLFENDNIYQLETDRDTLIGRPSELQSILITNSSNIDDSKKYKDLDLDAPTS